MRARAIHAIFVAVATILLSACHEGSDNPKRNQTNDNGSGNGTDRFAGTYITKVQIIDGDYFADIPDIPFIVTERGGKYFLSGTVPLPAGDMDMQLALGEPHEDGSQEQSLYFFTIEPQKIETGSSEKIFTGAQSIQDSGASGRWDGMIETHDPDRYIMFAIEEQTSSTDKMEITVTNFY